MRVNKDRFNSVVAAIEDDALRNTNSRYSFDAFCKEHSLYSAVDKHRYGEVMICCPFHGDSNPSLSINEGRRIWNCLGCNRGGGYLNFITEYDKIVVGKDVTVYDEVNALLRNDPLLRSAVGFESIFTNETDFSQFEPLENTSFHYRKPGVKTFLELATVMQKRECSIEQIKYAVLSMQSGLPLDLVYKGVFGLQLDRVGTDSGSNGTHGSAQYSIEEIEKEDVI